MTYVLPAVEVFQDFEISATSHFNPLRAFDVGPHAQLVRFTDDDEQSAGRIGFYDPLDDHSFAWPGRLAGAVVDQDYTKLFIKDALLRYFSDTVGSGSDIVKVSGYNNRIRSDSVNFKTHGAFLRDASLLDRDVKLGDAVKARFVPDGDDPVTLWTYVSGFAGDVVAATIAAATIDTDNADNAAASASSSQIRGPFNNVSITAQSAAAYDVYPTGKVTEKYTIIVTESSVGGDHTTARLRILSASGLDDVDDVTPSAAGNPTDIGTLGATATFSEGDDAGFSASASAQGVSSDDLIQGQRWELNVTGTFTAGAPTSGGTYTGVVDSTYIVQVVEGNKFATAAPKIKVTTTTGTDISGPTNVSAAAASVPIGTRGATISFSGTGLVKGDRFYVVASAETTGPVRTLLLGNNIPSDVPANTPVDLTLYIRRPELQIDRNREGFAPLVNFETSETEITVKNGIIAYDESWTDDGVQQAMEVESEASKNFGILFVHYRAWRSDLCNEIGTIDDVGNINDLVPGPLTVDNPLKWAVFKSLENANGTEVKFASVCNPDDEDSWLNVLELALGRDDLYGFVPLTRNRTVQDAFAAHVKAQSEPESGLWRVAWFNLQGMPTLPIVHAGSTIPGNIIATTSDGEECLCVVEDDPLTSGTQYTIVRDSAGNGNFVTNGVRAGDIVRTLYTGDGFGNATYSEYVVDEVQSENELRLLAGPAVAINTAAKIEIWRNLSATEEAFEVAKQAGSWGDRRIRAVWPDQIESSGTIQDGYHLCAALAGLSSGILPHQGMTRLQVLGFTDVSRTTSKFTYNQLNTLAASGTWIVTQEMSPTGQIGVVYTRHALTTGDQSDLNMKEEMLTRNIDSISYRFKDEFKPFIGVTNVTPGTVDLLGLTTRGLIDVLKNEKFTQKLGGQLIDATIIELRAHATLKDRIVLILDTVVPAPFNNFEIHLVI